MSGIVAYYYVGQGGGFMGSDGMAGKNLEIRIYAGNREWIEAGYTTYNYRPLSMSLKSFVPFGPVHDDTLRIAMILFASNRFETCPSFEKVKRETEQIEYIDFDANRNVPPHFMDLFEESKSVDISDRVTIYFAPLSEVTI